MRVAITVPSSRTGGIARYGWNLIHALHQVDGLTIVPVGDEAALAELAATVGPGPSVTVPSDAVRQALAIRHGLSRRLRAARVDVFHGLKHVVPAASEQTAVLTAHDDFLFSRPDDYQRAKRMLLPPVYRRSLHDAALVVAVSDVAASAIRARGLSPCVVTVRHPFRSDLDLAHPTPVAAVAPIGAYALFVGEWLPRKNLDLLVAVWPEVRARTGARLVIAGPPNGSARTLEAVAAAVDGGHVIVLGRVTDGELRWLYEHAHVTCVPSIEEGWGLPVTESLSLGTRVFASDHPALVEAGGGASMHLPLATTQAWTDQLTQILREPKTAPPASRDEGRGWPQVAAEVVARYEGLLAGSPG
jgi:glycosyltransferase involved in cell wall biosynthesis